MSRIRIGLMYADQTMIDARRMLFNSLSEFDVVFDEGLAVAALELIPEAAIDVLLVDTRLRGMSGTEFVTKMHRRYLNPDSKLPKVVLTSPFFSEQLLLDAIRAGATDLVTEADGAEGLVAAIQSVLVASQDINFSELIRFFELANVASGSNPRWLLRLNNLSEREQQVLQLLEHGFNDSKIATTLNITETSTRWAVEVIMKRIGVATRAQLALALFEAGVLVADGKLPKKT